MCQRKSGEWCNLAAATYSFLLQLLYEPLLYVICICGIFVNLLICCMCIVIIVPLSLALALALVVR